MTWSVTKLHSESEVHHITLSSVDDEVVDLQLPMEVIDIKEKDVFDDIYVSPTAWKEEDDTSEIVLALNGTLMLCYDDGSSLVSFGGLVGRMNTSMLPTRETDAEIRLTLVRRTAKRCRA